MSYNNNSYREGHPVINNPACQLRKSAVAVAVAATVLSTQAYAQLEEVIVTATKRAESMQDVPIAVTAMDQRTIEQAGITNIEGVALRTPGFSMGSYNAATPLLFIRGIGSNGRGAGGGEASVATFVDSVYINRAAGVGTEMFDLASVEVLRGPQGTLWGKNASAGVVNIKTRRPNLEELELAVQSTVGNEGIFGANAMISGPLGDTVAGKLTAGYRERDPWFESVIASKGDTGDLEARSFRGQVLFTPTSDLEILLTADYGKDERGGVGINAQLSPDATLAEAVNFFANQQPKIDYHESFIPDAGYQDIESRGVSAQLDWGIGEMTLTSITAYREVETDLFYNVLGTGLETFPVMDVQGFNEDDSEMFTQELRLHGGSDNLIWTAGLYYYHEETDHIEGGNFLIGPLGPLAGLPSSLIGLTLVDVTDQSNETDSYAGFGELVWTVMENLDLTFGARYSYEEKDFTNLGVCEFGGFVGNYDVKEDENWDPPTYKFVANYTVNDDVMTYLSVASGFKSGGWQNLANTEEAARVAFDEETVVNYELGIKSMWLDNSVRFNAAVFQTDFDDLQVENPVSDCGQPICGTQKVNAEEAEIFGVEMELTWAITDEFQLMGNYAYLDTEYTDLPEELAANEGNNMRLAPEHAYNIVALYETLLSGGGEVSFRAEYIYKDETEQDIQNRPQALKDDYELANFRLGYTTSDGNWEIAGWIKNAFDEEYLTHNFYNAGFGSFKYVALPQTYGVTVTWRNY
jgi:iron complex outermembrane receptor protein